MVAERPGLPFDVEATLRSVTDEASAAPSVTDGPEESASLSS